MKVRTIHHPATVKKYPGDPGGMKGLFGHLGDKAFAVYFGVSLLIFTLLIIWTVIFHSSED